MISYANHAVLSIAKSPEDVTIEEHAIGKNIRAFISVAGPNTLGDICRIVEKKGKWFGPAYLFCACSNHERVPIDVMFSKITDDNSEYSYIVASFNETTEIKALTNKIQEQSRMYEELFHNMLIMDAQINEYNLTKLVDVDKLEQEFFKSVKIIQSLTSGGANKDDTTE